MRHGKSTPRRSIEGYALLIVMMLIAVASAGLAIAGPRYAVAAQRDKEHELLRVGNLYAQALQRYYNSAPGNLRRYPKSFDGLARDPRYVGVVRYLRRIYPDPMQPDKPWGLVLDPYGGIVGVFSVNYGKPISPASSLAPTANAQHYSDWKFLADPRLTNLTYIPDGATP